MTYELLINESELFLSLYSYMVILQLPYIKFPYKSNIKSCK